MGNLTRYHAANLPELMEKINRNSIGLDDYLDRFLVSTIKPTIHHTILSM